MKRYLLILLLALAIVVYPVAAASEWRIISESAYFTNENRFINEVEGYKVNYSSIEQGRAIYEIDFTSRGSTEVEFTLTHYDGSVRTGIYKRESNSWLNAVNNTVVFSGITLTQTSWMVIVGPQKDSHPYVTIGYALNENKTWGLGVYWKVLGGGLRYLGFHNLFDPAMFVPTDSLIDNPIVKIDANVISGDPVRIFIADAYIGDIAIAQEKTESIASFTNKFLDFITHIIDNLFLGLWIIKFIFIDNIIALVVFIEGFGFLWALWTKGDIILSLKVFMGYNRELMNFFLDLISKLKPW